MSLTGLIYNTSKDNDREQWRRSLAEAGLTLVAGSFEEGATANSKTDAVWYIAGGQCYTWDAAGTKTVPAKSTPESAGGEGAGKWESVADKTLKQSLAADNSAVVIAGIPAYAIAKNVAATGTAVEAYPDFLTACMNEESVILSKGVYAVGDITVPNTAKLKTLIIRNSTLKLTNYNLTFERASNLVIDISQNGVIDLGLKKALVTADAAPGATQITVDNASVFSVGDHLTTSVLAVTNSKWANDIRVTGDAFNLIQSISGNVLTMQYGVDAGYVLYKNTYVGNAKFAKSGLTFKGAGSVTIIGGEVKESRAGYYVTTQDSIALECRDTKFSGQFLDGFQMLNGSSIYFKSGSIIGSYDPAKQTVVWNSSGDLTFDGTHVHRGNFDMDIYHNATGFKHGTLRIVNGARFDGSSLLPLKATQTDTINGGTVGDHITYLTDSLHVHTINSGNFGELIYSNSSFVNYRRALTGTDYNGATADVNIDSVVIDDVTIDCSPFYYRKNTFNYRVGKLTIDSIVVKRSWNGNFYPLGYSSLTSPIVFGGRTKYYPNGLTDDESISALFIFDTLEFSQAGTSKIPSTLRVGRLIVDNSTVTVTGSSVNNKFTEVILVNGGTLSSNPFLEYISTTQPYWSAADATFIALTPLKSQAGSGYFGMLNIAPFHRFGGTGGLAGQVAFYITEGAAEVTVAAASSGLIGNNSAKWVSAPVGVNVDPSVVTVKLKVVGGVLQMNASAPAKDIGLTLFSL